VKLGAFPLAHAKRENLIKKRSKERRNEENCKR
jgi:hypothetical protein